jgi:hypothetical protein
VLLLWLLLMVGPCVAVRRPAQALRGNTPKKMEPPPQPQLEFDPCEITADYDGAPPPLW